MRNIIKLPKLCKLIICLLLINVNINNSEGAIKLLIGAKNSPELSDYIDNEDSEETYTQNSLTYEEDSKEINESPVPKVINMNTSEFKQKILSVIKDVVKNKLLKSSDKNSNDSKKEAVKIIKGSKKVNRANERKRKFIKQDFPLFGIKEEDTKLNRRENSVNDINNNNKKDNNSSTFPFTACIMKKGSYLTHGALLNDHWVVSAAFDLFNVRESIKLHTVHLGSSNCKKGQQFPLKSIQIHPFFTKGLPDFDVAMLKMAYPVKFTQNIHPISILCESLPLFAVTYTRKGLEEHTLPNKMTSCELEVYPWEKCRKWLRKSRVMLNETSRCVRPELRCQGWKPHTSAPLIRREGLVGILSGFQPKPSMDKDPMIFTALSTPLVENWIEELLAWK